MAALAAALLVTTSPAALLGPGTPTVPHLRRCAAPVLAASLEPEEADAAPRWPLIAATTGSLAAVLVHAPAFARFASQWAEIANSGVSGDELWAPFRFWLFFAAMHPLLKPAVWIGEVLHTSPGPALGLLPLTFIAANALVIGALFKLPALRGALNVALVGAFISYIGAGLDGATDTRRTPRPHRSRRRAREGAICRASLPAAGALDLSDYNLALDDGVSGCPTYAQARPPPRTRASPRVADMRRGP